MLTIRDFEDYITNGIKIIIYSEKEDKYITEVFDLNDLEYDNPLLDLEVNSIEGYTDKHLQINVETDF